jgi:hypothetical protein
VVTIRTASFNTENSVFFYTYLSVQYESPKTAIYLYCGRRIGFLIKAHGVLCEVRYEGNVDLLVFRANYHLYLLHCYNSLILDFATIKNHALLAFSIVRFLQVLLRQKKSRSPPDTTAFTPLNKFRRSVRSLQLPSDITCRSAVAPCGTPHFPEWPVKSSVTQNVLSLH